MFADQIIQDLLSEIFRIHEQFATNNLVCCCNFTNQKQDYLGCSSAILVEQLIFRLLSYSYNVKLQQKIIFKFS
jgi:hypothetical protein